MNKILGAALGLAVASTALLGGVAPAQAAVVCDAPAISDVAPLPTVVVTAKGTGSVDVLVEVKDSCHQSSTLAVDFVSPLPHTDTADLEKLDTQGDFELWGAGLDLPADGLVNAEAGSWSVNVTGTTDGAANPKLSTTTTFKVLRASTLTTKTSATKVKKNAKTTVSATLARADWEKATTPGYGKQKVDLQFQSGSGSFKTVKTLTTDAKSGVVKASLKVTKAGCYRAVYKGNSTTAAVTSKSACVKLK